MAYLTTTLLGLLACVSVINASCNYGFAAISRPVTDTARQWTYVDREAVGTNGVINEFAIYVNGANRGFRIGVFRPKGNGNPCDFTLVDQKVYSGFAAGYQKVSVDGGLKVNAGDHLGFSWVNYGVAAFKYVAKGNNNYCENSRLFNADDSVTLVKGRHDNREYSIEYIITASLGYAAISRPITDTARQWTYVNREAVGTSGVINEFGIYVNGANRGFRIGVFRPKGNGNPCDFTLVDQKVYSGFPAGYQTVSVDGGMRVEAGDHLGFSWVNYGVAAFKYVAKGNRNYCENSRLFNEDDSVTLVKNRHDNREYSIEYFIAADESAAGFAVKARSVTDTAQKWTYVNKQAYENYGVIRQIHLYSKQFRSGTKKLNIGVYSPRAGTCKFTLKKQVVDVVIGTTGSTVIQLPQPLEVDAGDHFGWTWTNYGTIAFDYVSAQSYCENSRVYGEGDNVDLVNGRYGNREYSIQAPLVTPCEPGQ